MEARFTYRLRVNASQKRALQEVFDSCRFVWNQALGRWSDLWQHEQVNYSEGLMSGELTDWRSRFDWLADVPVTPQQQTLIDLGRSIRAFFDKSNPAGRPKFKKRGAGVSARWTLRGFSLKDNQLSVAVNGGRINLRVVWSRELPSEPRSVTVYRDACGRWWASFVTRVEAEDAISTGETTGLDVGLTTFATTEFPDADIPNPRYARRAAKALARSQRNTARKQRGSNNRVKAKHTVALVHAKVKNQRKDFVHKQARTLARRFDRIGVEDLRIKNMSRRGKGRYKSGLNRLINDAGWGQFLNSLEWHARKCGHVVVRINPRGTTQTCSDCGVKAKQRIGLADRIFSCSECGLIECRDRNAARNLNPNRLGNTGVDIDGSKSLNPAGTKAA